MVCAGIDRQHVEEGSQTVTADTDMQRVEGSQTVTADPQTETSTETGTGRQRLEEILRQTEKYARWVAMGRNDTDEVEQKR